MTSSWTQSAASSVSDPSSACEPGLDRLSPRARTSPTWPSARLASASTSMRQSRAWFAQLICRLAVESDGAHLLGFHRMTDQHPLILSLARLQPVRSDAAGGPIGVSPPRRRFADAMSDDMTMRRSVVASKRALPRVCHSEYSARGRGMRIALPAAHRLPGLRQRLLTLTRGRQCLHRSSGMSAGAASTLFVAGIRVRWSHCDPPMMLGNRFTIS